jgi:hypothetical protein
MKTKLIIIAISVLLTFCTKESPYVQGIIVKKEYIKGHFENQRPIVIEEASILGFIGRGGSSSFSSSSSRSSSYSSSRSSSSSRSYSSSSRNSGTSSTRSSGTNYRVNQLLIKF